MLLAGQSASFSSGGRAHISHGQFSYQYGPVGQDAGRAQRSGSLQLPAAALLTCLALPAAFEVYVGSESLDTPCEEPLAQWLLADGAASLALLALSSLLLCRLCATEGEQELQLAETRTHEVAGGVAVAQYQERHKQLSAFEQRLLGLLPYAAALPALLLLAGWVLRLSATYCDQSLFNTSLAVILYKPLAGVALCCCWPCCLGLFGMTLGLAPSVASRPMAES